MGTSSLLATRKRRSFLGNTLLQTQTQTAIGAHAPCRRRALSLLFPFRQRVLGAAACGSQYLVSRSMRYLYSWRHLGPVRDRRSKRAATAGVVSGRIDVGALQCSTRQCPWFG